MIAMFMTIPKVAIYMQNAVLKRKRTFATNVLYWRRSGLLPLKLIRSNTVDATTNVDMKH